MLLMTGRNGTLGLCNFNCAFSVGGDGFFWVRYFMLCLSMINPYPANVENMMRFYQC